MPIAIVSACLLGEYCRYDGKTKKVNAVLETLEGYEIIPFCPEAPLFGTPRERIDVVLVNGENRIITHETKKDVTSLLEQEIKSFVQKHSQVDRIILKSKSPSCGFQSTPILDTNGETLKMGSGVAATIFQEYYSNISIEDENSLV